MKRNKHYQKSSDINPLTVEDGGVVYVLLLRDKVKIGATNSPKKRIMQVESQIGERVEDIFVTRAIEDYLDLEKQCHRSLSKYRGLGEWFYMSFDDAVLVVKENLGVARS